MNLIEIEAKYGRAVNRITKTALTPVQDVRRRNKILRKGKRADGTYAVGGSEITLCTHQRVSAWKRIQE